MKYIVLIISLLIANKCFALYMEGDPLPPPPTFEALEVDKNAISWQIFAKTKAIEKCHKDDEDFEYCYITPEYSDEILSLNKKEVTLIGFMFPLGEGDKQTNFLIGPYPLSCPFDYHSPPSQMVEVITKKPVNFSFDPISIKGILETRYEKETGIFYYLTQK